MRTVGCSTSSIWLGVGCGEHSLILGLRCAVQTVCAFEQTIAIQNLDVTACQPNDAYRVEMLMRNANTFPPDAEHE
jgi:hypothetical protein